MEASASGGAGPALPVDPAAAQLRAAFLERLERKSEGVLAVRGRGGSLDVSVGLNLTVESGRGSLSSPPHLSADGYAFLAP